MKPRGVMKGPGEMSARTRQTAWRRHRVVRLCRTHMAFYAYVAAAVNLHSGSGSAEIRIHSESPFSPK